MWVKKFIRSVGYAWEGIVYTVRTQRNMRIHFFIATPVLLLSVAIGVPKMELLFIWLCTGIVLSAELMNTAVERAVDLISPEYHALAKAAKDAAAGAVLMIVFFAVVAVLTLLTPHLYHWVLSWLNVGGLQ